MCIYYEVVTSLKSRLNEYANASAHISFLQKLFILQLKVLFMQGQIHTGKWIATVDAHNLIPTENMFLTNTPRLMSQDS